MPWKTAIHEPASVPTPRQRVPESNRQARRALPTNSSAWRLIRASHLQEEPLCREHLARGMVRAATEVDHIDGDATNDAPSNRQSLCKPCHSRKTARENGGFGNRKRACGHAGAASLPAGCARKG